MTDQTPTEVGSQAGNGDTVLVPHMSERAIRYWVDYNAPGAKADGLLAFLMLHGALKACDGDPCTCATPCPEAYP